MHYILIIGAFVWFAFLAPPMLTVATIASFALVCMVGVSTVKAVTGAQVSLGEVFRSIGLAFVFAGFALVGMMIKYNSPIIMLVMIIIPVSYVLGFSIGLDLDFGAACVVALVATGVSVPLYFLVKSIV